MACANAASYPWTSCSGSHRYQQWNKLNCSRDEFWWGTIMYSTCSWGREIPRRRNGMKQDQNQMLLESSTRTSYAWISWRCNIVQMIKTDRRYQPVALHELRHPIIKILVGHLRSTANVFSLCSSTIKPNKTDNVNPFPIPDAYLWQDDERTIDVVVGMDRLCLCM